ncbi:heterokaryon incompatibility protein-domain-containing protein [Clohesyomyces aquaticus]|uniref:Heterokaryon incompatibility protein-domain-containing protein n=1 Tax=Clohesyomyces aquaticus TaxID=1231657 RepID=A0A1Y2AAB7_9PLEO|nr:heterokaryon incompatibility protein-domain-containing protein [Clohesyomyces aquaticus]
MQANLSEYLTNVSFFSLPKTFQDAVVVTRRLGVRFLWIDVLCIIQDSEEDKDREIARMAAVYDGSFLTLAAVASVDPHGGCSKAANPEYDASSLEVKDRRKNFLCKIFYRQRSKKELPMQNILPTKTVPQSCRICG